MIYYPHIFNVKYQNLSTYVLKLNNVDSISKIKLFIIQI